MKIIEGQKIGKLRYIKLIKTRRFGRSYKMWQCECDCGRVVVVDGRGLSCGCLRDETTASRATSHGNARPGRKSAEYLAWINMKFRCYNKNHSSFKHYGGRGIQVCDRWRESFVDFFNDMGKRPSKKHSLDRYPDINGNYEKNNCRWATTKEQARNKRNNFLVTLNGETKMAIELAEKFNKTRLSIRYYKKFGYSINEIIDHYSGVKKIKKQRRKK